MLDQFNFITQQMMTEYAQVQEGNMMRSPAMIYKNKVFAFYHRSEMVFKLDELAALYKEKYPGSSYLSPFKNKPPMKGWLKVPAAYHKNWKSLAELAYQNIN